MGLRLEAAGLIARVVVLVAMVVEALFGLRGSLRSLGWGLCREDCLLVVYKGDHPTSIHFWAIFKRAGQQK